LIDEFGKGTCKQDGISLFCSVIKHLSRLKEGLPNSICKKLI
jgi:DNA mismatch repair ATPase MutS